MTTIPNLESQTLYVHTESSLTVADSVLGALREGGIRLIRWSVASEENPLRSRLTIECEGGREAISAALANAKGVFGFEMPEKEESVHIELALVRVRARGSKLDEAAEIVGNAGGRLLSLSDDGFSAQVSSRPEKIEAMLGCLRRTAPVEAVRSGRLMVQK